MKRRAFLQSAMATEAGLQLFHNSTVNVDTLLTSSGIEIKTGKNRCSVSGVGTTPCRRGQAGFNRKTRRRLRRCLLRSASTARERYRALYAWGQSYNVHRDDGIGYENRADEPQRIPIVRAWHRLLAVSEFSRIPFPFQANAKFWVPTNSASRTGSPSSSSMAITSRRLSRSSSRVAPCEWAPGNPGTYPTKKPVAVSRSITA